MLKKISILVLILSLLPSCMSTSQKSSDMAKSQKKGKYETVNSKAEADKMNANIDTTMAEEVEVEDRVFFALDSHILNKSAKSILDKQAEWLEYEAKINIIVEGHCDERGSREYNIALGEKRANATRDYLVSKGIAKKRITTVSYGKERPALIGDGEAVWAKNRRAVTVPTE